MAEHSGSETAVIAAIAAGGMLGAATRHAVSLAMPTGQGFPWGRWWSTSAAVC